MQMLQNCQLHPKYLSTELFLFQEAQTSNIIVDPYIIGVLDPAALPYWNFFFAGILWPFSSLENSCLPSNRHKTPSFSFRLMDNEIKGCKSTLHSAKKFLSGRTCEQNSCYGLRLHYLLERWNERMSSSICIEMKLYLNLTIRFNCLVSIVCL